MQASVLQAGLSSSKLTNVTSSSPAADSSVQLFLCFLKDIRQMIKRLVTDLFKCNVHQNNFGQVHCDKAEY